MSVLTINEHKSASYAPRTYHNSSVADLTLAVAVDFNTAGEKLTHKAAGEKYLPISYYTDATGAARQLYRHCKRLNVKTLNIAGNGIYTFFNQGIDQVDINQKLYEILSLVHKHWHIEHIVSGGQTGVDTAGAVVACALGIPCTLTLPKRLKMRFADGVDVSVPEEQIRADINGFVKRLLGDNV